MSEKDVEKLGMALAKLAEEDPTFQVRTDEASGQTVISGMGELHLEIMVDRLKDEFDVEVELGMSGLRVNYTMSNVSFVIVWKTDMNDQNRVSKFTIEN